MWALGGAGNKSIISKSKYVFHHGGGDARCPGGGGLQKQQQGPERLAQGLVLGSSRSALHKAAELPPPFAQPSRFLGWCSFPPLRSYHKDNDKPPRKEKVLYFIEHKKKDGPA
ncbi:Protein Spinster 3 [Manis pentadactyla]|nr:Protein Spinster 3 [Manis pentadactyla]